MEQLLSGDRVPEGVEVIVDLYYEAYPAALEDPHLDEFLCRLARSAGDHTFVAMFCD